MFGKVQDSVIFEPENSKLSETRIQNLMTQVRASACFGVTPSSKLSANRQPLDAKHLTLTMSTALQKPTSKPQTQKARRKPGSFCAIANDRCTLTQNNALSKALLPGSGHQHRAPLVHQLCQPLLAHGHLPARSCGSTTEHVPPADRKAVLVG